MKLPSRFTPSTLGFAFVVYANSIGEPPVMGVKYIQRSDGAVIYSIYTKDRYFEVENQSMIVREEAQSLGIPIIEYPANNARLGAFEIVLPLAGRYQYCGQQPS